MLNDSASNGELVDRRLRIRGASCNEGLKDFILRRGLAGDMGNLAGLE